MKAETVLRKIERHCREERKVYASYKPPRPSMTGAKAEARGIVWALDEMRDLCRCLRKENKKGGAE